MSNEYPRTVREKMDWLFDDYVKEKGKSPLGFALGPQEYRLFEESSGQYNGAKYHRGIPVRVFQNATVDIEVLTEKLWRR